jgi:hypothetical protein
MVVPTAATPKKSLAVGMVALVDQLFVVVLKA